jgi:hypothetical protein
MGLDISRYVLSLVNMSLSSMPHILAAFHSMHHMLAFLHSMSHTPVSQSVMLSTDMCLSSSLLSYICQPTSLPSSYVITIHPQQVCFACGRVGSDVLE